jgi:dihydroorotase
LLIKNAKLANGKKVDILIEQGKFVKIEENISVGDKKVEVIDASGKYLLPGMIDAHTHMREPGFEHKESFVSGSRACAKGGVTTFIDMPNTNPPTIEVEALEIKRKLAKKSSIVDYGFHFGGSSSNNKEEVAKAKGVLSTKIFLNVSTGKMLVEDLNILDDLYDKSRMIMVHAEEEMVQRAIDLAKKHNKKLVLAHISLEKELDIVREARKTYKDIYVEVSPHHLLLNSKATEKNKFLRMKPELKSEEDRLALWEGIADGTINTIGTDHAPHLISEKEAKITFGIPGVEWALPLMLNEVNKGKLELQKVIELYSENPARIFGIKNKGAIREGYDADFVIVDMDKENLIKDEDTVSKCSWSPYSGMTTKGVVEQTFVRGKLVYDGSKFYNNEGQEVEINE